MRWARMYVSIVMGEPSARMALPMDMKNLAANHDAQYRAVGTAGKARRGTHPNVAAEPSMYCPSVRIIPF